MTRPYELAFRVTADPTDVRDLGNGLKEAIRSVQKRGQHEGIEIDGPTITCVSETLANGGLIGPAMPPHYRRAFR